MIVYSQMWRVSRRVKSRLSKSISFAGQVPATVSPLHNYTSEFDVEAIPQGMTWWPNLPVRLP